MAPIGGVLNLCFLSGVFFYTHYLRWSLLLARFRIIILKAIGVAHGLHHGPQNGPAKRICARSLWGRGCGQSGNCFSKRVLHVRAVGMFMNFVSRPVMKPSRQMQRRSSEARGNILKKEINKTDNFSMQFILFLAILRRPYIFRFLTPPILWL